MTGRPNNASNQEQTQAACKLCPRCTVAVGAAAMVDTKSGCTCSVAFVCCTHSIMRPPGILAIFLTSLTTSLASLSASSSTTCGCIRDRICVLHTFHHAPPGTCSQWAARGEYWNRKLGQGHCTTVLANPLSGTQIQTQIQKYTNTQNKNTNTKTGMKIWIRATVPQWWLTHCQVVELARYNYICLMCSLKVCIMMIKVSIQCLT